MPKKRKSRLWWRDQGGERRAWGDFRDFADVGGKREPLIPAGESYATTDPDVAAKLAADRVEELERARRAGVLVGTTRDVTLRQYAAEHLVKKARGSSVSDGTLAEAERRLGVAVDFFESRGRLQLASIGVEEVQAFALYLPTLPNGRGGKISGGTQRHHLNDLGNLFRRAISEGAYRQVNPVWALMEKPKARKKEADFLEVWEGALLLESARTYPYDGEEEERAGRRLGLAITRTLGVGTVALQAFCARMQATGARAGLQQVQAYIGCEREPTRQFLQTAADVLEIPRGELYRPHNATARNRPSPMMHPLLAAFLLTGGREREVYGLELGDASFRRETVTIRPNRWRGLKTEGSHRTLRMWPQLREILEPWAEERRRAGAGNDDLLFPSPRTGGILTDTRRALDALGERAGWQPGELRTKMFRHSYCAARLQTLDRGFPVANRTVADELGHGGEDLVRKVYGHLGQIRHRSEFVEYRIEQQREEIPAERLRALLRVA